MTVPRERVIFCEGYSDRAFWSGWLRRLGCVDPSSGGKRKVQDPHGSPVGRGQFAFRSRSGGFIRVVPCEGKENVLRSARIAWNERAAKPIERLIVCLDADSPAESGLQEGLASSRAAREQAIEIWDPARVERRSGSLFMDRVPVSIVLWATNDPAAPELGEPQTLDRLVAAALCAAWPDRRASVARWIADPPAMAGAADKAAAWSHYAKWWTDHGPGDFFRAVWDEGTVARELETRLRAIGAWDVAEAIAA